MAGPGLGYGPDGARDDLRVDAHRREFRQHLVQFAKAHQRLAADDGQVHGLVPADEAQDAVDERLPLEISKLAQHDVAAPMRVAIGVAARTAERAFTRDPDGEIRPIASQDPAPGLDDVRTLHPLSLSGSSGVRYKGFPAVAIRLP